MQYNARCHKCGHPLTKVNGHIGYCQNHQWVSVDGLIYEAEASAQNHKDMVAEKNQRLNEEHEKELKRQFERDRAHQIAVRRATLIASMICLCIAMVVFFIIRPSLNYTTATNQLSAGEYDKALQTYEALGDYKDSAARALLCDALIDLQNGYPENTVVKLEALIEDGQGDIAGQLATALLPMMENWDEKGLTPQVLFLLLDKANIIDPNGTLDISSLTVEGHTALLDGTQRSSYADDINADGMLELIVLNEDYSITAYRMTSNSNIRIALDNTTAANCELTFGNEYKDADWDSAIACFSEAYRLLPNAQTRTALANAYRTRALGYENAGDMNSAITDARNALNISNSADDFSFFYDMNLRNCKNGHDSATAITQWENFAADSVSEITRYSAQNRWKTDAAQLHIAYATELAAQKNALCLEELNIAADMDADISAALEDAKSYFEPSLVLARLRLMEMDIFKADSQRVQQIQTDMANEVRTAINEWNSRGIASADVPALIYFADQHNIDLNDMNRDAIYEEAAIDAAGYVVQYTFVDWNNDGYKELLTLNEAGTLALHGIDKTWGVLSSIDTKIIDGNYTLTGNKAPLILILSKNQDELLVITGSGTNIRTLFRESGISRYDINGSTVTFSRLLEGSIVRYNDFTYEATDVLSRPVRTSIDWQQTDYPAPESALAAVQRYFEAYAYDIAEEAQRLTEEASNPLLFEKEALFTLAIPDIPGTVNAKSYLTEDNNELFEVTYASQNQTIRTWIAAEYIDGWKVVGAADTYGAGQNPADISYDIELLTLNAPVTNTLPAKGSRNTYRVLVPTAGRLALTWQSGTKAVSRTAHTVTMYRGSLTGDTLFTYDLQPSVNRQQSKDMFVSAGVYYITVEAVIKDTAPYHLTLTFDSESNVELENNDTSVKATVMTLNTSYSGTLSSSKDVDFFSFTLTEDSAVNVTLGTAGNGSKSTTYVYTVWNASSGARLSTVNMAGNMQLSQTGNLYLSSGTYLVQVVKGSSFTNNEYMLTVSVFQSGTMESESNNTQETADSVSVNDDIHASIGQEGDIDWYTFTLQEDALIQPRFTFAPTDSSSKTYVLTLLDNSRRELMKVNIGGKESTKVITPIALKAGKYSVKIENPRFVRQDYTLRLVSSAVEIAESEPNGSAALATDFVKGKVYTGVLNTAEDTDYYKLTFDETTTVTLKFSFPQSTLKNTAYVLTVEQNGKTQFTANMKGESGGNEWQLQFPAGVYYIKVKPSTWMSAVYTLSME